MTPARTITDTAEDRAITRNRLVSQESTGPQALLTNDLDQILQSINQAQQSAQTVLLLSRCSDETGGYVRLQPEYGYVPVLIGSDHQPVPLYEFVEVIDGAVDYEKIREELPSLSYAQINGAISFIRKISQCNPRNVDFDRLEDEELAADPVFLEEIRKALEDKETSRVLNLD